MIIKYFKQDNTHSLWAKIAYLAELLICCAVIIFATTVVLLYGVIDLFADMPAWGIMSHIVFYIGYIYIAKCIYKFIEKEVKNND